jgi:hypothetical protein
VRAVAVAALVIKPSYGVHVPDVTPQPAIKLNRDHECLVRTSISSIGQDPQNLSQHMNQSPALRGRIMRAVVETVTNHQNQSRALRA